MNKIILEDLEYITNASVEWSRFEGKTVLITGASGILASYLVRVLLYLNSTKFSNPSKVIGLVRSIERARKKFQVYSDDENLILLEQDVCETITLSQDIHFIIHAASQASPKYYGIDPVGTLNANVLGTNNLLKLAKEKKVESFLFFSSSEVYGNLGDEISSIDELQFGFIDPTNVRSCYSESKRLGETMCISWKHQYGVPVKIVRPFHTYGPGLELNDGRVFSDFISDILNNRNIQMKSDGSATRAFCYISDAIIAYFLVLLKGEDGQAYNVGNDKAEVSILDLAEELVRIFPEKGLKVIRLEINSDSSYLKSAVMRSCPNVNKIQSIGWEPKISIREGFKRTIFSLLSSNAI